MPSAKVRVTATVTVEIPRADLWPWDGSVTNSDYAAKIEENPSGNLIDFAQYDSVKVTDVRVTDT
jgi:hypothetical protein